MAEMRTFTSRTGKTIEAEIKGASATTVQLRDASGKTYMIAIDRLSAEDQECIRVWQWEHGTARTPRSRTAARATETGARVPCRGVNGLLFVLATIQGKDALLLVDTGSQATMLSESFSKSAALEILALSAGDLGIRGGFEVKGVTRVVDLKMAGHKIPWPEFVVVPDAQLPPLKGRCDGVVGSDFLARFEVIVDYGEKELILDTDRLKAKDEPRTLTLERLRAIVTDQAAKGKGDLLANPKALQKALRDEGYEVEMKALLPLLQILQRQLGI